MRGTQSLPWLVLCVAALGCTDSSTSPSSPAPSLAPQLSKESAPAAGPNKMFAGLQSIASTSFRASAKPSKADGGVVQAWADIDCRSTFTDLKSCEETYHLEVMSKGQLPGAVGHIRGKRVANDGTKTLVYELDARLDCLTITPAADSPSQPPGVNIWVSGPVESYTVNGQPLPNPGGTSDVLVRLVQTGSHDNRDGDRDRGPRDDDQASLMYSYIAKGCTTQTPVAVTPRAVVQIEGRRRD